MDLVKIGHRIAMSRNYKYVIPALFKQIVTIFIIVAISLPFRRNKPVHKWSRNKCCHVSLLKYMNYKYLLWFTEFLRNQWPFTRLGIQTISATPLRLSVKAMQYNNFFYQILMLALQLLLLSCDKYPYLQNIPIRFLSPWKSSVMCVRLLNHNPSWEFSGIDNQISPQTFLEWKLFEMLYLLLGF